MNLTEIRAKLNRIKPKYFASLDLSNAFYNVILDPASRDVTTFDAGQGVQHRFCRLPFGLNVSPSLTIGLVSKLIYGDELLNKYVTVFMDDILAATNDELTFYTVLERLFDVLRDSNLKLTAKKCRFFLNSVAIWVTRLVAKVSRP